MVILNLQQEEVLEQIQMFLRSPITNNQETIACVLVGCAGSGKTTLTKHIVSYARKLRLSTTAIAPTHKARKVLNKFINEGSKLFQISTFTIASLLGKLKTHSYIGTKNYQNATSNKLNMFDLFIIDEVSMISDSDYNEIMKYATMYEKKIVFVGDDAQIPNPVQHKIIVNNMLVKKDSEAFSLRNCFRLIEPVRQSTTNPLVNIYHNIRTNLDFVDLPIETVDGKRIDNYNATNGGYRFIQNEQEFASEIKRLFNPLTDKVITYTNSAVQKYNKIVRKKAGYTEMFVVGEILMGYTNIESLVENGQEYVVDNVTYITNRCVDNNFKNLSGWIVTVSSDGIPRHDLFFIDVYDDNNSLFLSELVTRADKVNMNGSSKTDRINYMQLKTHVFFLENIYNYQSNILTENEMKLSHQLLFTKITDILDDSNNLLTNETVQEINHIYPQLLTERLSDKNKSISDSEVMADRFQVIEKDCDYGYAVTTHKSQGSTYYNVFIDELSYNKIRNKYNYKFSRWENRCREKNQLKYVAYTRPQHSAIVLY